MKKRIRKLSEPISVISESAVGGLEEGRGNFGHKFDFICPDDMFGEKTFERAEEEMARMALGYAFSKQKLAPGCANCLFAGDLQNQCVGTSLGLLSFGIPLIGLYGACSTCTEAILSACLFLSEGGCDKDALACAVTCSHNSVAERQFRTPLEYGGQRAPTAQWTATASGAFILGKREDVYPKITEIMVGKAIDGCISDVSNMGCAMAPGACDTICDYLYESGKEAKEFDAIVTGDLGKYGSEMLHQLCFDRGYDIESVHLDCGCLLYNAEKQDVHAGASGCGCSASLLACHFIPEMRKGTFSNILFLSTGALMNPTSVLQKQNIAGIAPLIHLQTENFK